LTVSAVSSSSAPCRFLGRGQRHRRDQRPNRLRMAGDRDQAERRTALAEEEVDDEQPPDGRRLDAADHRRRALLEAVALEQADHRQHDPDDGDDPVVVERLAEGGDDLDDVHSGDEAGGDRGRGHHQHRIEPQREAGDDDQDSEEDPK
jgi:hypothetical protein